MAHDFKKFPELTNRQMELYYNESPHKQIVDTFQARVVKITDGDTIRVTCEFRDFDFPVKLIDVQAPEKNEGGYRESKEALIEKILGEEVDVIVNPNERVGKWGRILGKIYHGGININEEMIREGHAVEFSKKEKPIPIIEEMLNWRS